MLKSVLLDAIAECETARAALPDAQRRHLDDLLWRLHEAMFAAVGPPLAAPPPDVAARPRRDTQRSANARRAMGQPA